MTAWRKTVDIKQIIDSADIPDAQKPGRIAAVLANSGEVGLAAFAAPLRAINGARYDERKANRLLQRIYDWADDNLVWMG